MATTITITEVPSFKVGHAGPFYKWQINHSGKRIPGGQARASFEVAAKEAATKLATLRQGRR